jgi:hypothetical protein
MITTISIYYMVIDTFDHIMPLYMLDQYYYKSDDDHICLVCQS